MIWVMTPRNSTAIKKGGDSGREFSSHEHGEFLFQEYRQRALRRRLCVFIQRFWQFGPVKLSVPFFLDESKAKVNKEPTPGFR